MAFLQSLLDSTQAPILYAFLLGIMTAFSPCPLATNITAVGFISKEIENRRRIFLNGLLYTLGRGISYTAIGLMLFAGASKFHIARFFASYGEKILGPLLILIGLIMLDLILIRLPGFGNWSGKVEKWHRQSGRWGSLVLGMLFALAFCPYSGVLYFGMLIPMTIASPSGLYLPLVFALATGLPVIIIAWILAYSVAGIGNFYNRVKTFEKWFRRVVAVLFIGVGIYYVYLFYLARFFA